MKKTDKKITDQLERQIKEMCKDIENALLRYSKSVLLSGMVSEEEIISYLDNGNNYRLAKAIVSAWMRSDPYGPSSWDKTQQRLIKNIGLV